METELAEYAAMRHAFQIGANIGWFMIGLIIGKLLSQDTTTQRGES